MEKEKKQNNNMTKILIGVILVLVIALVAVFMVMKLCTKSIPDELKDAFATIETTTLTNVELSQMTEQVGELTTQKYYYKDIHEETKEKEGFFDSEELTLIVYEGVIHAGIDLQEIRYEINEEAKKITVNLPAIKIISHDLNNDTVQSYDVKKSIFNKGLSYADSAQKFDELKQIKEEAMMKDEEFIKTVKADTETTLTNFFQLSDLTKDYTFEFIHAEPIQE